MAPPPALVLLAATAILSDVAWGAVENSVTAWNLKLEGVLINYGIPFQLGFKYYAMLHQAQIEALRANGSPGRRIGRSVPDDAAIASASHTLLTDIFPGVQSTVWDPLLASQTSGLPSSTISLAFALTANMVLRISSNRRNDGTEDYVAFVPAPPGSAAGQYQWTPGQNSTFMPQLGGAKAFYAPVTSIDLSKYQPLDVNSQEFLDDLNSVYANGRASASSTNNSQTADFWFEGPATYAPHFNRITMGLLSSNSSEYDTAKTLLMVNAAGFDASVAAWKLKYLRLFWRPVTVIHQGIPSFLADSSWDPHENTPPFPEYPSGHSTMAGAFGAILTNLVGGDSVTITTSSFNLDVITGAALGSRTYNSISSMVSEIGLSRVYAGVHYSASCKDGARLGGEIGQLVLKNFNF